MVQGKRRFETRWIWVFPKGEKDSGLCHALGNAQKWGKTWKAYAFKTTPEGERYFEKSIVPTQAEAMKWLKRRYPDAEYHVTGRRRSR